MEPEQQRKKPKGYTKLAKFTVHQDHVILKQFSELAVRDLLYLQAELCDLEYDYVQQSKEDVNSLDEKTRLYDREWCHLRYAAGGEGKQWKLALQIREKLREYYSAIQQYQNVAKSPRPTNRRHGIAYSYTLSASLGGDCDFLGRDLSDVAPYPSVLSDHNSDELLFLGDELGNDHLLARILIGPVLSVFHRFWRSFKTPLPDLESQVPDHKTALHQYSDARIRFVVHTLGSVVSTIIPIVSVIVLYLARSMPLRLGLVCVFSVSFSIAMSVITDARRVEIYAATAAFASVHVVFISTAQSP
ncbi:hypothetical protein F4677DRAFT_446623 [Hypoxylon crocopeplum]|nr:hypothetical protein F4677DRAFT_446623 [Hypoxylon crocopeplum]